MSPLAAGRHSKGRCMTPDRSNRSRRVASGVSLTALTLALALAAPASAQDPRRAAPQDPVTVLDEIVVKGQALRRDETAFSTTTLTNADIVEERAVEIEDMFRDVPGMNVREYSLAGVANQIVLRGFGNGGHGGDVGFVVDGIPLNEANSHADGYVDTNVLVPLEIDSLRVYRGPISALYGNFNRAGLIAFETRKGGDYAEADLSGASYDTFDAQGAFGRRIGGGDMNLAAQYHRTDGYRPQSNAERATLAGRYGFSLTPDLDVAISTRLHTAESDNPAYLTPAQFAVDPYGIDPRVLNDGTEKNFATVRGDVNYTVNADLRLLTFVYGTQQDFTRWFTRGPADPAAIWRQREETYDRQVYGLGANLNGLAVLGGRDLNYVVGVEGFSETTEFQFYDGLDSRRRVNPALNDRESEVRSASALAEATYSAHRLLDLQLGFRADRFEGDCTILGPEAGTDPCDDFEATGDISPKLGVQSQVAPWLRLRASYAEGFALPDGFTKYAPGAQSLDPNKFDQVEIGARVAFERLDFDLAAYRIHSSQEFRVVRPGEFENFGATERTGIEASLRLYPTDTIELGGVYSYADSEIVENFNPAFIGNQVAGVPEHTLTLNAAWTPIPRLRLDADYRYLGEYQGNVGNSFQSDSYSIFDLGVAYDLNTATPLRVYADLENVADEVYVSSFSATRAPGAPRTLRIGVQFGF